MNRYVFAFLGLSLGLPLTAHSLTCTQKVHVLEEELDTLEETTFHEALSLMVLANPETLLARVRSMDKESLAHFLPQWERLATLFEDAAHHEEVEEKESSYYKSVMVMPLKKVIQEATSLLKKRRPVPTPRPRKKEE